MENYLERFKAMVDELRSHPDVVVTHFNVRRAAHPLALRKAASFADVKLSQAIVDFYSQCDGLQLRWFHKGDEDYDQDEIYEFSDAPFDIQFPPDDGGEPTGCVNILPISMVFSDSFAWEGIIWRHTTSNKDKLNFGGKDYPRLDFLQSVQPFDQFNDYYNIALVFAAKNELEVPLVMGKNQHSDYCSSKFLDFETYLEFVLKTKGSVDARPEWFALGLSGQDGERFSRSDLEQVPVLDLNSY